MYHQQPSYDTVPAQAGYAPPQYSQETHALPPAVYGAPANAGEDQTATQQFPNPMGKYADLGVMRDVWFALLWIISVIAVFAVGVNNIATDNVYYEVDGNISIEVTENVSNQCQAATENTILSMGSCTSVHTATHTYYTMASCDNDGNVYVGDFFNSFLDCDDRYRSFSDLKHDSRSIKFPDSNLQCLCNIGSEYPMCVQLKASQCTREMGSLGSDIPKFVAAGLVVSLCVSIAILFALRMIPKQAIIGSNIVAAVLFLGLAALVLGESPILSLFCVLFAALIILVLYCARHRIPFAATCLQCSSTVVLKYWGVIVNAFIWVFAQVFFGVIWYYSIGSEDGYIGLSTAAFIAFIFLFYWGMEVFKNINHVTMCGVTADWFFSLGGPGTPPHYGGGEARSSPTPSACLRAAVWSLGSICFGSLIVAIVSTIRSVAENSKSQGHAFVRCLVIFILRCIEDLIRYFNDYAYVQVAMFGKSYLTAAMDTISIIQQGGGWEAIINDSLIDRVYFVFSLLGSLVVGFAVFFMAEQNWMWFVVGLIEGFIVISIFMRLLYSGVMTVFIGFWHLRSTGNMWNPPSLDGVPVDEMKTKLAAGYNGDAQV